MTSPRTMRFVSRTFAALVATALPSCQLAIGLDDYYLAPVCPVGAALCTVCNDPGDCGPGDVCHTWTCVGHLCQPINAAAGAVCTGGVCSDVSPSTCVACNEDADCGQADSHCYEHACFRCDDGVQNGDESEVDCGGACPRCLGYPCSTGPDCKTGFCADGYCCDTACAGQCQACNVPWSNGTCVSNLPVGTVDDKCLPGQACNGSSQCVALGTKAPLGGVCTMHADCFNVTCVGGFCRLGDADPCSDDVQCATSRCDATTHQCASCMQDSDCTSNRCVNGTCKAALGEPCSVNGDCELGVCTQLCNPITEACLAGGGICKIGPGQGCPMDPLDCLSGFCEATGTTCALCTSDADCGGTTCGPIFFCTFPAGAYCSANNQCQSMTCTGFPPRCQ